MYSHLTRTVSMCFWQHIANRRTHHSFCDSAFDRPMSGTSNEDDDARLPESSAKRTARAIEELVARQTGQQKTRSDAIADKTRMEFRHTFQTPWWTRYLLRTSGERRGVINGARWLIIVKKICKPVQGPPKRAKYSLKCGGHVTSHDYVTR